MAEAREEDPCSTPATDAVAAAFVIRVSFAGPWESRSGGTVTTSVPMPATVPPAIGGDPPFRARSKEALEYAVAAPGQLGLGRAYVAGAIEIDDMEAVISLLNDWQPPPVSAAAKARLIAAALRATGVRRPPPPPKAEMHLRGRKHTSARDREAVRHHYDVGNEVFSL